MKYYLFFLVLIVICLDLGAQAQTHFSQDYDGDQVINLVDQDDDNDGLLDYLESPFATSPLAYQHVNSTTGSQLISTVFINLFSATNVQSVYANGYLLGANNSNDDILFTFSNEVSKVKITVSNLGNGGVENIRIRVNGNYYLFTGSFTNGNVIDNGLGLQGGASGAVPTASFEYTDLSGLGINTLQIESEYVSGAPMGFVARVEIGGVEYSNNMIDMDTDGDLIFNRFDRDSDNDSCSDMNEANFIDNNNDKMLDGVADSIHGKVLGIIYPTSLPSNVTDSSVQSIICNSSIALPIVIKEFSATNTSNCTVRIVWQIEVIDEVYSVELQRNSKGANFETINNWDNGSMDNNVLNSYLDNDLEGNENHSYRLKLVFLNGDIHYSKVRNVINPCKRTLDGVTVFPNPAVTHANITGSLESGVYALRLTNQQGQLMFADARIEVDDEFKYNLNIQSYPAGMYFIQIINNKNLKRVLKLIIDK